MNKLLLISFLLSGLFFACKTPKDAAGTPSTDIISITHGTSFGMCRGYCHREEVYTTAGMVSTQRSVDSVKNKPIVENIPFSAEDFNNLVSLLDRKAWNKLEERIGCPDCTDRGSEYIIVTTASGSKKVTFDAHADIPELSAILSKLRRLKNDIGKNPMQEDK